MIEVIETSAPWPCGSQWAITYGTCPIGDHAPPSSERPTKHHLLCLLMLNVLTAYRRLTARWLHDPFLMDAAEIALVPSTSRV